MIAKGIATALALQLVLAQKADWDPRDDGPDSIDVADYPAAQQKEYPLFRVKCANRSSGSSAPSATRSRAPSTRSTARPSGSAT